MEEKDVVVEETTEELEVQSTFNTDNIDILVEDGTVENVDAPEPEGIGAG